MKRYFIAGLLVWIPIWVTYVVITFIIRLLDGTFSMLPVQYQPDNLLGFHLPGLGLIVTLIVIFVTGILAANFLGKQVIVIWEKMISRIPLIRSIYSAVKQVLNALLQPSGNSFRKVMLIEYPRQGIWSVAFLTSNNFQHAPVEQEMITVFIPTTPNPTSGFLMIIPKKDAVELNMSVEEALRMVISLGVVSPDKRTSTATSEN